MSYLINGIKKKKIINVINRNFKSHSAFILSSFPVIKAASGTSLEGKVGGLVKLSRVNKIAYLDKFYIV